jgi:predicted nucleic acid-binding protein
VIAIDTSSMIAYLEGERGADVEATGVALEHRQAVLPPVVLSELLSDPQVDRAIRSLFEALPLLELRDGYWQRAGLLRARIIASGKRARLADTLIAQSCLDHDVLLVTRDADFRHFARSARLRLAVARAGN